MKKILTFIFAVCVVTSCYDMSDKMRLQAECDNLASRKNYLENDIVDLRSEINNLRKEKSVLQSGREPKYIVKFKIKQGTFTLDIFEHAKNEMNSIEIEVPVNRDYYNRLSIGQDITDSFKWGSLVMDCPAHTVHYAGHEISLTNREFMMLRTLLENVDIVLSRDTLLEKVCGYEYMGETNMIDVYIRYLRSKIDDVFSVKMIQTVRGVGYVIKSYGS